MGGQGREEDRSQIRYDLIGRFLLTKACTIYGTTIFIFMFDINAFYERRRVVGLGWNVATWMYEWEERNQWNQTPFRKPFRYQVLNERDKTDGWPISLF